MKFHNTIHHMFPNEVVLRFIELHKASNTGRGPNREGCDDEKMKLNDRHEINHRVRCYDATGTMRRFRYDADNSLEAHMFLKMMDLRVLLKEMHLGLVLQKRESKISGSHRPLPKPIIQDDSSEGSSKDGKMAKSKRVREDTDYEEDKKLMPEGEPEGQKEKLTVEQQLKKAENVERRILQREKAAWELELKWPGIDGLIGPLMSGTKIFELKCTLGMSNEFLKSLGKNVYKCKDMYNDLTKYSSSSLIETM
ncbi:hypothetical protein AgCh_038745 [Apium graveolens]